MDNVGEIDLVSEENKAIVKERESKIAPFVDTAWDIRGTDNSPSKSVQLPEEYKSGYGLPLTIAIKEHTHREDDETISTTIIGIFEKRSLGSPNIPVKEIPVGYLIIDDSKLRTGGSKLISYNNRSFVNEYVGPKSIFLDDPLFSQIESPYSRQFSAEGKTVENFKRVVHSMDAIHVGFDYVYADKRTDVLNRLKKKKNVDTNAINDLESSTNKSVRLSEYMHTGKGIGTLMIDIGVLLAKKHGRDSFTFVGMNENSQNLVKKTQREFKKTDATDLKIFSGSGYVGDLVNFEVH